MIRIRSKLKDLGYPIWSFKEIDTNGLEDFIDKLVVFANPNNTGDSVAKTAFGNWQNVDSDTFRGTNLGYALQKKTLQKQ